MSDIFNSRFCLLCFLVHLLFSQGFSNLWKPSGEDKEFQSLYFSMTALRRVPRWILLRLTVPLFAQIFHTVASKFTKKSSIGSPRENFLGLAIILTLKRGSVSRAEDPWLWKCHTNHDQESVKSLTWREMITFDRFACHYNTMRLRRIGHQRITGLSYLPHSLVKCWVMWVIVRQLVL